MNSLLKFRLGTRASALALWQANWVKREVEHTNSGTEVEIVPIKTTGDRILDVPLAEIGGKGLFTKELDEALLDGRIDFAVHSLKDVPFELPQGLAFGAFPAREEPWDAFLSQGPHLDEMKPGMTIGTSSLRRHVQLRHRFPALNILPLRGNVDTRLRKLDAGEFGGIVLAAAGLKRLGYAGRITELLGEDRMLPAVGQGALAVVCRTPDARTLECLAPLDHPATRMSVTAERGLLETLQGSCQIPIAGLGRMTGPAEIHLKGLISDLEGVRIVTDEITGTSSRARELGVALGEKLLARGADRILAEIREHGTSR